MKKNQYKVLGVMSGTSLDGVDIVTVTFHLDEKWHFSIENFKTISYSKKWKEKLKTAIRENENVLRKIDKEYTLFLAEIISGYISKNRITNLDAVCSHGHTIKHEPQKGITLQIGNLPILSKILDVKVVCDFRQNDVTLGGQGAPLVPIGDELLFPEYEYCLNLGGFANISTKNDGSRIAYDICAVNTVFNHYAEKLGYSYDAGGKIAASGKFDEQLFLELQQLPFYKQLPPKSLGMEWVNSQVFPLLQKYENDIPSVLNTYTRHVASQVARSAKNANFKAKILVTGGGAFNSFLVNSLKEIAKCEILLPSEEIINFKEALIFAFLGVLKLRGENNVLASVTGASHDHSSGKVFEP